MSRLLPDDVPYGLSSKPLQVDCWTIGPNGSIDSYLLVTGDVRL